MPNEVTINHGLLYLVTLVQAADLICKARKEDSNQRARERHFC